MSLEQWEQHSPALRLVEEVLRALRQEYEHREQGPLFEQLQRLLEENEGPSACSQAAEELGMSQGAVKIAALRLRHRFQALLHTRLELPERVGG